MGGGRPRPHLRVVAWVSVVLAVAASLGAGWVIAGAFRSPEQVVADSAAPPASTVTAPVETGTLERTITVRGAVNYSQVSNVTLADAASKVVTKEILAPGSTVGPGQPVIEINGQPVFALAGQFPMYRDLRAGDKGPDVRAVQEGLVQAGYDVSTDGILGPKTQAALSKMFTGAGYPSPVSLAPAAPPVTQDSATQDSTTNPPADDVTPDEQATQGSVTPEEPVVLPMAAVVVAPGLPAILAAAPAIGRVPEEGAVLSFAAGDLRFVAAVTTATAAQMTPGMTGSLSVPGVNEPLAVAVTEITTVPKDDGTVEAILVPTGAPIPAEALGAEVVAEVRLDPGIDESLVVPSRAVIVRGDDSYVRVQSADGEIREVAVTELATSLGRSAVEPVDEGALTVGDDVVLR